MKLDSAAWCVAATGPRRRRIGTMNSAGGVPYLGSRIMLISKKEIRYEGILYTIDSAASTVALQNVRSFGTEDRLPDNPVPGNDQVFDYIIFRGSDIKDLHVCEEEGTAPAPPPATSMPAAAPEPTAPSVAAPSVAAPSAGPSVASPKKPAPAWGANPSATRAAAQPTAAAAPPASRAATGATRGGRVQPGNGAHMSSRASRGVGGGKGGGNMEQAFDFEKMLAGFDKIAMEREAAKKVKSTEYDKTSSFFDTLDEQVDEKRKGGRVFMAEMRKVDALTFGEELIRQRGRGGGKGGKGLARGNGRDGGRGAKAAAAAAAAAGAPRPRRGRTSLSKLAAYAPCLKIFGRFWDRGMAMTFWGVFGRFHMFSDDLMPNN